MAKGTSDGIFVFQKGGGPLLPTGSVVEVEGFTDPGDFAPVIEARRVTRVRDGRLPAPRRAGYDDLVGGAADGQWVEIDAVVRGTGRDEDGRPQLLLRFGPVLLNEYAGYLCIIADPDGHHVEFSYGQALGRKQFRALIASPPTQRRSEGGSKPC